VKSKVQLFFRNVFAEATEIKIEQQGCDSDESNDDVVDDEVTAVINKHNKLRDLRHF